MSGLSPAELESYHRDGFLILSGRFAQAVPSLRDAVAAMLQPDVLGAHHVANPRLDFDGELLKMVEPCLDISPGLAAFAQSADVRQIFTSLFDGVSPLLFEDKIHMKLPTAEAEQAFGGAGAFPWHQDRVFWSTYSRRLATLVIYLDEVTEANGALQLLPHPPSEGELPHFPGLNFPLELAAAARNNRPPVTALLSAGSAILFDCMTPHASLPNISTAPRRSFFLSFNPLPDGDGYNMVSTQQPLYQIGSHNLGHLPCHKIAAWREWRQEGEPTSWQAGGGALIWGTKGPAAAKL